MCNGWTQDRATRSPRGSAPAQKDIEADTGLRGGRYLLIGPPCGAGCLESDRQVGGAVDRWWRTPARRWRCHCRRAEPYFAMPASGTAAKRRDAQCTGDRSRARWHAGSDSGRAGGPARCAGTSRGVWAPLNGSPGLAVLSSFVRPLPLPWKKRGAQGGVRRDARVPRTTCQTRTGNGAGEG